MINKKSRTIEWITDIAKQLKIHDIALAEKTIRAFSLLEALAFFYWCKTAELLRIVSC